VSLTTCVASIETKAGESRCLTINFAGGFRRQPSTDPSTSRTPRSAVVFTTAQVFLGRWFFADAGSRKTLTISLVTAIEWFYIDERTPEISIGVKELARGQGIGEMLLRSLIAEARGRGLRLCLNIRSTNPARRLYERVGFQVVPEMTVQNRVGGQSFGMVLGAQP
jgi:GNAT superfamily N-acetyltransferase